MRSSMLVTTLLAALTANHLVDAHGYAATPTPRSQTINGHRYRWEPQSDGQFNGECWDAARGQFGPVQAEYTEGQVITTQVVITAFHKGWHQIRLCEDRQGKNNCFSQNLATALTNAQANDPTKSNLIGLGTRNYQWQLPANFTCDHCSMQWWWRTDNYGNEHFKSCHDVRIVSAGPPTNPPTNPPPTPSPPTAPPTNPPPTNPPTAAPPTSPPTPAPRDMCSDQRNNHEYNTGAYRTYQSGHHNDCCADCKADTNCVAFSWTSQSSPFSTGSNTCRLHTNTNGYRARSGVVAGFK